MKFFWARSLLLIVTVSATVATVFLPISPATAADVCKPEVVDFYFKHPQSMEYPDELTIIDLDVVWILKGINCSDAELNKWKWKVPYIFNGDVTNVNGSNPTFDGVTADPFKEIKEAAQPNPFRPGTFLASTKMSRPVYVGGRAAVIYITAHPILYRQAIPSENYYQAEITKYYEDQCTTFTIKHAMEHFDDSNWPRKPPEIPDCGEKTDTSEQSANTSPPKANIGKGPTYTSSNLDANIGSLDNPLAAETVSGVIAQSIRIMLILAGLLAVVVITIAGFQLVVSGENPDTRATAIRSITWSVVGLIVSILSFSIVAIVQRLIS